MASVLVPPTGPGDSGPPQEFVPVAANITTFEYGQNQHRIYATLGNTSVVPVSLWQFRYEPLFIPRIKIDGSLNAEINKVGQRWQIRLPIYLYTRESSRLAYEKLKEVYSWNPTIKMQIDPSNVTAFNVKNITSTIDLTGIIPNANLQTRRLNLTSTPSSFDIIIYVPNKEQAEAVTSALPHLQISYDMSFSAKTLKHNFVEVKRSELRTSALFAALNGLPGGVEKYVHRDDARSLSEGISTSLAVSGIIENPDELDKTLLEKVLSTFSTDARANLETFDDEKWKSTYNSDDLKPDVITSQLEKMFTKTEGQDEWKYNANASISGKASFLDILSGESNIAGSYTQEGLRKRLEERDIEVQFDGNKIIAKSVKVSRMNLSTFSNEEVFTSVMAAVSTVREPFQGTIDLGALGAGPTPLPLAGRIETLERLVSNLQATEVPRITERLNALTGQVSRFRVLTHDVMFGQGFGDVPNQSYDTPTYVPGNDIPTRVEEITIAGIDTTREEIESAWATPIFPLYENIRFRYYFVEKAGPNTVKVSASVQDHPPASTGPIFGLKIRISCLVRPKPISV